MAKFCRTYKVLCVCPGCPGEECGRSPRTRAEAEIARACRLNADGSVVEDGPTTARVAGAVSGQAPARPVQRKVELPPWQHPEQGKNNQRMALSVAILCIVAVSFGGWLLLRREEPTAPAIGLFDDAVAEEASTRDATVGHVEMDEPPGQELVAVTPERDDRVFEFPQITHTPREVPTVFTAPTRFVELRIAGNQAARRGNFAEARRLFQQAIAEAPTNHEGYNNLANTFTDEGNHSAAEPIYIESLRIDPSSATTRFNLANSYLRGGRWAEAEREFLTVLGQEPADWEAALLIGVVFYRQEKWNEAVLAFQRVLDLNPSNAAAHYNLHLAYYRLGATHLARSYLAEAIRLDPELRRRS